MSKRFDARALMLILLSTFCLVGSSLLNAKPAQKTDAPTYLFVQIAKKAKIEINKTQKNTYTVTLKHVSPYVTYFSERPKRTANTMPMEQFLKLWTSKNSDSFAANAPNADFNAVQMGLLSPDKPLNVVLELSQPVYDKKAETLTYTAKPLEGNTALLPDSATLDHVVLFIDDACLSCW